MSSESRNGNSCARFRYSKVACNSLHFVIVDIFSDGRVEFWSQEPGDVRWFSFDPVPAERDAALSLAALSLPDSGAIAAGWPRLD